jgi:ribosomal protein L37AE/L43A
MTPVESLQTVESGSSCPLCHTVDETVTRESLRAGGTWTCARCGQTWDNERLERVAEYLAFEAAHPALDIHKSR